MGRKAGRPPGAGPFAGEGLGVKLLKRKDQKPPPRDGGTLDTHNYIAIHYQPG